MLRHRWFWLALWGLLGLTAVAVALAIALDPEFGTAGVVVTDLGTLHDDLHDAALQTDGKIVLVGQVFNGQQGDIALVRYEANGRLDPSFGSDGIVLTDIKGFHDSGLAIAIQPDGRLVVAGATYSPPQNNADMVVLRYDGNGRLDNGFGNGGIAQIDAGGNADTATAVALQADGQIVVVGISEKSGQADVVVARLTAQGAPDLSFGTDGLVRRDFGSPFDQGWGLVVQPDGKLVVAGMTRRYTFDFALLRLLPSGQPDSAFGEQGLVVTDIAAIHNQAQALVLQPEGKLVVAGYSHQTAGNDGLITLARYETNGRLDPTFGNQGAVLTQINTADLAHGLALQPDGKLLVVADSWNGKDIDAALLRYLANGRLDESFAGDGIVTTDLNGYHNGAAAVLPQPDGKIVVTGSVFSHSDNGDFYALRYIEGTIPGPYRTYLPVIQKTLAANSSAPSGD